MVEWSSQKYGETELHTAGGSDWYMAVLGLPSGERFNLIYSVGFKDPQADLIETRSLDEAKAKVQELLFCRVARAYRELHQ